MGFTQMLSTSLPCFGSADEVTELLTDGFPITHLSWKDTESTEPTSQGYCAAKSCVFQNNTFVLQHSFKCFWKMVAEHSNSREIHACRWRGETDWTWNDTALLSFILSFSLSHLLFLLTGLHCCWCCMLSLVCCKSNLKVRVSRSLPYGNCSNTQSSSDVFHHCK